MAANEDERCCTVDEPEQDGHPRCFKCERYIKSAVQTKSVEDYWDMPWGVAFRGGDNFGSRLYDSFVDGIHVDILVCDDCLEKRKELCREFKREPGISQFREKFGYSGESKED